MTTLSLIILLMCLAASFCLSGMEAGVFALSRLRIRRLMREGNSQARLLYRYLENTEDFLWTILVGNTLANFVAVALVVVGLHNWLSAHRPGFWLVFIPGGLLFYALCDLLPKMLFRLRPNRLCLRFVPAFRVLYRCLRPVVWLMAQIAALAARASGGKAFSGHLFGNRDELRLVMQESSQALTSEERGMINRVLDLQDITVRLVTVPMAKVVTVTTTTSVQEVLRLSREHGFSRLPVWRDDSPRRRIAGLVNARSLLYEEHLDLSKTAGDYLKPALYLDADRRLEDAMRQLQRSGQRLAIVLDRNREEIGVVTLQDMLQAVFGEFRL